MDYLDEDPFGSTAGWGVQPSGVPSTEEQTGEEDIDEVLHRDMFGAFDSIGPRGGWGGVRARGNLPIP